MITGSQAMIRCLQEEGVRVLFGYPGATIAPFYDSLRDSGVRHILTRGEQSAGHAASGYARITGKPGVCVVTSGPGATNLFTAIATAYSDSIPLVAITGQVATYQLGRDVFQEVDTTGAAQPFTKYSYLVKSANELGRVFKEAFHIASTGRQGPVLIDVPVDVQQQLVEFTYPDKASIRGYKPAYKGHALQIAKAADAIRQAKRPVICYGGGVFSSGAADAVRRFCEASGIPAVSTMMGVGALPPGHPLYLGMIGQSGVKAANQAIRENDLLVLIGARVGNRAIISPDNVEASSTIVHIDIDTAEIGKNMGTEIPIVGDALQIVEQLLEKGVTGDWRGWADQLRSLCEKAGEDKDGRQINPNRFVRTLCRKLPEQSAYVADVGQNQIWSARNFISPGRFLTSGGMGTMGYSIPAAIGAKLASPGLTVVAACGDGSFQMSMPELATICQHDIPIKIVIFKNGKLGMVREIQENSYNGREMAVDLAGSPDFEQIAKAYGIGHGTACAESEAEEAIDKMLASEGAYVLVVEVDEMEGTA